MSENDLMQRCDVCHRLVSVFVLVIEADPPYRRLCSYCRFDHSHPDPQETP